MQELLERLSDALGESDALPVGEPETKPDALVLDDGVPGGVGETVSVGDWEVEGVAVTLLQALAL